MSALPNGDTKPLTYRVNLAQPLDLAGYEANEGYAALDRGETARSVGRQATAP